MTVQQKRKAELLEKRKSYDPRKALKAKPKIKPKDDSPEPDIEEPRPEPVPVSKIKPAEPVLKPEIQQKVKPPEPILKPISDSDKPVKLLEKSEPEKQIESPDKPSADAQTKTPRPFLKRKTQKMKGGKLNWNAQSRTDCWGPPK
jgi:hypothetical protein